MKTDWKCKSEVGGKMWHDICMQAITWYLEFPYIISYMPMYVGNTNNGIKKNCFK